MKIRVGFVSNSSSSSFIVIGTGEAKPPVPNDAYQHFFWSKAERDKKFINIPETFKGECEFGWSPEKYKTFGDRLNWAALCAMYKEGDPNDDTSDLTPPGNWTEMLVDVLKEDFKVDYVNINFASQNEYWSDERTDGKVYAYIDHQSAPYETPENARMFESKELLRQWLYCADSYIQGGNDNSWDGEET